MTFVFVMSGQEPSRSWSVLNLGCGFTFLFSSVVSSRRVVTVILSGSGVLTVWLVQSEMAVCFYRSSFQLCLFGLVSFLFVLGCWLSALLPGPFFPSDSAPSVWRGVTLVWFLPVFVLVYPAFFNLSLSAVWCCFVLSCVFVRGGGVRSPGEFGVLVHPSLGVSVQFVCVVFC